MSWRAALLPITLLSLTQLAGCAARSSESEAVETGPAITVVVDNRHGANVNVYLVTDATRTHLGMVVSQQRGTLTVPPSFLVSHFLDIQVVADALGGGSYVSERVRIFAGDEIDLHLTDRLANSWITVDRP